MEGQTPPQPPDTFGYPTPGYNGPPPGAYSGEPPMQGYVPNPSGPYGYPPNPNPYMAPPPPPMPKSQGIPWWGWLLGGCLGLLLIGGIACGVLGAALGSRLGDVISRVAHQRFATAASTQTFTVTGSPSFVVNNPVGNLTYQAGTGNTVTVEITRRAGDSSVSAAQNDLRAITATASQSGDTITIQSDSGGSHGLGRSLSVDIVITGPAAATFAITNGTGNVTLTDVRGVVTTNVQAGNVDLEGVTLASGSRLRTNVGTITMNGQLAAAASVEITISVGSVDVTLPASTNTYLSATTDTGSLSITGWSVQSAAHGAGQSANGDLGTPPSGTLTIHVNTGSITLTAGS